MAAQLAADKLQLLRSGTIIPAIPLALDSNRQHDEARQRMLSRYYMAAGTGGIAVAVHSTQFEIRDPEVNLFETVLRLAAEEVDLAKLDRPYLKIAGICGPTAQAVNEANIALKYGYDMALLSMGGLQGWTEDDILDRVSAVADVMPVFGFYLQPSVGGRIFTYEFWLKFAEIPNVLAIKVAAFNRYQTLDVVRAVCNSSRNNELVLYTGNDDNIVPDLLTTYRFNIDGQVVEKEFIGGLLGHWAVWTNQAVALFEEIKAYKAGTAPASVTMETLLTKGVEVTDMNAAIFDPAHAFHGCIPGIHEVLRRQGLLEGRWCLNPKEELSEGQMEEIDRVCAAYPHLVDDQFVLKFLATEKVV